MDARLGGEFHGAQDLGALVAGGPDIDAFHRIGEVGDGEQRGLVAIDVPIAFVEGVAEAGFQLRVEPG